MRINHTFSEWSPTSDCVTEEDLSKIAKPSIKGRFLFCPEKYRKVLTIMTPLDIIGT